MNLDPWFVDLDDEMDPRHLAEDEQGWAQHHYGPGEEEDGQADEQDWLSPEVLRELERAWEQTEYDPEALPF